MKLRLLVLAMFAFSVLGHAQQYQTDGAAQPEYGQQYQRQVPTRSTRTVPNWSGRPDVYPGSAQQTNDDDRQTQKGAPDCFQRPSAVESMTRSINPNDVDYGGLLALWRLRLVHDTILSTEYWGFLAAMFLNMFFLAYIYWLHEQRADRRRITIDIAHQLRCSAAFARFHAHRVIRIHNKMVRELNDEYERKLRSGEATDDVNAASQTPAIPSTVSDGEVANSSDSSDAQEEVRFEGQEKPNLKGSIPQLAAMAFRADLELSGPLERQKATPPNSVDDVLAKANAAASASELNYTKDVEGEDKDALIRRLKAQLEAKDQRHQSLRNAHNRLRSEVYGERNSEREGEE